MLSANILKCCKFVESQHFQPQLWLPRMRGDYNSAYIYFFFVVVDICAATKCIQPFNSCHMHTNIYFCRFPFHSYAKCHASHTLSERESRSTITYSTMKGCVKMNVVKANKCMHARDMLHNGWITCLMSVFTALLILPYRTAPHTFQAATMNGGHAFMLNCGAKSREIKYHHCVQCH